MKDVNYLVLLGMEIKKHRLAQNLSQEALAGKCNFHRTYISMLERGKRNPSIVNLLKLCNGLEIKIDELVKGIN